MLSAIECDSIVLGIAGNDMNWIILVTVWRQFGVRLGSILGKTEKANTSNHFFFRQRRPKATEAAEPRGPTAEIYSNYSFPSGLEAMEQKKKKN